MKLIHYIYISAALVLLSACSGEEVLSPTYTVGEADNAIVLTAGVREGASGVQTRAVANPDANHAKHLLIEGSSKLFLRIDGDWKKTAEGDATPISQTTTATVGGASSVDSDPGKLHNSLEMDPVRYWDDYGTADPNNASAGRTKGLTIYGAGINDGTSAVPTIDGTTGKTWTELYWNVGEASSTTPAIIDQNTTNYWKAKDLITSNNVVYSETSEQDNAYKFENRASGKLLEFTHAMTKITVNLTANNGFTVPTDGTDPTFKENVSVTLLGFNYMGKVDVEGKTSQPTDVSWNPVDGSHSAATANIKAKLMEGGKDAHTAKFEALVFPGNTFNATITDVGEGNKTVSSSDPLLELNADGNIYKVTAAQLVKAIKNATDPGSYEGTLAQGVNYVINIIVNKTEVKVNATVKDWETVESEEVSPVINVNTSFSGSGSAIPTGFDSFSFYRSASDPFAGTPVTNKLSGYRSVLSDLKVGNYYAPEGVPTGSANQGTKWTFSPLLYWPNHSTHYHFRGVWPETSTLTTDLNDKPHVKMNSTNDAQVIDIKNVPYSTTANYPSNLMIGMPEFTTGDGGNITCKNDNHTSVNQSEYGICATEGLITLNFKYIMSQVEVILSTSASTSNDYVNIGANTVVEIVNVYNNGYVKLGDRTVVGTDSKGNYTLNSVSGENLRRHSAIVPQTLTYTNPGDASNVRFKITVTNDDAVMYTMQEWNDTHSTSYSDQSTYESNVPLSDRTKTPATQDIYFADINPISYTYETGGGAYDTKGSWNSGVHYKYSLKLTKTEIKVTATITDWVTVNASEDVWF